MTLCKEHGCLPLRMLGGRCARCGERPAASAFKSMLGMVAMFWVLGLIAAAVKSPWIGVAAVAFGALIGLAAAIIDYHDSGWCLPDRHTWYKRTGLTVPMFDPGAKGELWRCRRCPKVVAK